MGIDEQSLVLIREALEAGQDDANVTAHRFGTSPGTIRQLRHALQAEWHALGKGRLPVPPPSKTGYGKQPFSETENMIRAAFIADPDLTVAQAAAKFNMGYHRARYVLDKEPSAVAARARGTDDAKATLLKRLKPHFDTAVNPINVIAQRIGHPNWADLLTLIRDTPEYQLYHRRYHYNQIVGPRPPFEQFCADWDLCGQLPHYRNGVRVTD